MARRDVIWIAVILLVIAVVILDGMAIFRAYQSADDAASAAEEALTEYAQTTDVTAAKLAAAAGTAGDNKGISLKINSRRRGVKPPGPL